MLREKKRLLVQDRVVEEEMGKPYMAQVSEIFSGLLNMNVATVF